MTPARLFAASLLLGCAACDTLDHIQKPPSLSSPGTIGSVPATDQLAPALLAAQPPQTLMVSATQGSLWRAGAKTFFRDPRARGVGDLLTVEVLIQEQAEINNQTNLERDSSNTQATNGLFGAGTLLGTILPFMKHVSPDLSTSGQTQTKGSGDVKRTDTIKVNVAATVLRVLPNNNLEIVGTQEIRINNDLREVAVRGIVRPEDIKSNNTIPSGKIAEARIVYGGRGVATDLQRPTWGQDILNRIQPF